MPRSTRRPLTCSAPSRGTQSTATLGLSLIHICPFYLAIWVHCAFATETYFVYQLIQFMRNVQMCIRDRLETTELSISAVAEQTGFASAAHFRRVFHEVMGLSLIHI